MSHTVGTGSHIGLPLADQLKAQAVLGKDKAGELNLIGRKTENRLINTQARIEYELLKSRVLKGVDSLNRDLAIDDQILVQTYKLCLSLRFRRQSLVMEFRQLPTDMKIYNHALDLIFQGINNKAPNSGRTTLVLVKERNNFSWRHVDARTGGPSGDGKVLSHIILRWLADENSLFMRFLPV